MIDWRGEILESKFWEQGLLLDEAANLGSDLACVEQKKVAEMITEYNISSSAFTVQAASLIDEGLREKSPISWEELQLNVKCYVVTEDSNCISSVVVPILNQSVFLSRIAKMAVHDELMDRLGKVLGEGAVCLFVKNC